MSETKFTPEKLSVEHSYGSTHLRTASGESIMCDETYYPWVPKETGYWHLFAASPELFSALEELSCFDYRLGKPPRTLLKNAALALAKARGEQ